MEMWTEEWLDEELSTPSEALIEDLKRLEGDIMILGAGGKVGPTLSVMLRRACTKSGVSRKVYAVSRFTDPFVVSLLEREQVETISCDLTDEAQIAALPRVPNIIFMAGRKFGTDGNACETWKMNVDVPAMVTRHFGAARYVVFSTGNVYPFSDAKGPGCNETVAPSPVGEYAMSSLGRERMFEYAARHYGAKVLIYRLNYAVDLRYGVLYDLASPILAGKPVSVATPSFNCVWQRYANEVAIRSLLLADNPPVYLNVTGPETYTVREAATRLAKALGREVTFTSTENELALLSDSSRCMELFGRPDRLIDDMIEMQAKWLLAGGRHLDKPTHFEERKGKF